MPNLVDENALGCVSIEIFCVSFSSLCLIAFVGRSVNLAYRATMSRSLDYLFDDSSDSVPPCDKIKNVMMDLFNVAIFTPELFCA